MKISLDARLSMVANLITPNRKIVDVGTDHAYLPAFMVLSGLCSGAIASDVRQKPIENASETVKRYHLTDKINLRLSDGLGAILQDEAEEIVIAGMGGTQIVRILEKTPWLMDESKNLVIQPMTHSEDVRTFLCENCFSILKETAVVDNCRLYIAMKASYTGVKKTYSSAYLYIGEFVHSENWSKEAYSFIKKQYDRLIGRSTALKQANKQNEEAQNLEKTAKEIKNIMIKVKVWLSKKEQTK